MEVVVAELNEQADQAAQAATAEANCAEANCAEASRTEQERLTDRIGYNFVDVGLLREALSHRSWCHERKARALNAANSTSNERLEFLGDAVIDLCVCELAVNRWPHLGPGELSAVRSAVVNARALAQAAQSCELGRALLLGKGETATGGAGKESILADALEAVVGAVYLDGGLAVARDVVERLLGPHLAAAAGEPGAQEAKNRFQELVASRFGNEPNYDVTSSGPAHRPRFVAVARVASEVWGRGIGSTKRAAEHQAAHAAYRRLLESRDDTSTNAQERAHG